MNSESGNEQRPLHSLQLARYRFHWRVTTPLQLPPYASSTLRGVFGHALRHLACLTRASHCKGCAVLTNCPYPALFEPQSVPRVAGVTGGMPALAPYAIETPFKNANLPAPKDSRYQPGDCYSFNMVLMTPAAIHQLPLIIAAWQQAFAGGVGPLNGKAELIQVEHLAPEQSDAEQFDPEPFNPESFNREPSANSIFTKAKPQLQRHWAELPVPLFSQAQNVQLHLQTPLRIAQQGQLIKEWDMTASLFLHHLIRRVSFQACTQQADAFTLDDIHQLNALADQVQDGERQLSWCDWERYSSRQKQKMKLGGLIGHWQLLQVPPQLLPLVYLGQWLHVGKEVSFGLGQYQWQSPVTC